jgi:hypothetical protein
VSEFATGLIPRDYSAYPSGYCSVAPAAPDEWLIPENEWEERLREQKANRASLLDLRERYYPTLKSLNQGQHPLCWGFSTTKSGMYLAHSMGDTSLVLSPWWIAGKANGWRNQGGWCTLSLKAAAEIGAVEMQDCPSFSRSYDTSENAAKARTRRVIEWYDGSESRDRNRAIMISAFLIGRAPVLDFNHIGHSMCGCYLESINPLVIYCDNSWGEIDQYGPKGLYKLTGNRAIPDGIVVPRVIAPSE